MNEWPLVGRAEDLQTLARWLGDGKLGGAVLAGAAGVGKTRLAAEFLQAADESGYRTGWVVGSRSASGLPFGAVASMLPELGDGQSSRVDNRADLMRRIIVGLGAQARGRRLVIVVDDAHLLDGASAALVLQLARTEGIFVLVTVRAGETAPDAITALWKDGIAPRLDLGGLSGHAVLELLEAVLDGQVDPAFAGELAARCDGNVLFLQLLVQGASGSGAVHREGGVWCRAGPLALPGRLVELLQAEVNRLDPAERDLLEVVAYGEPLPVDELASLDEQQVLLQLDRRNWLTMTMQSGRLECRLRHPLYSDLLREQMPVLRMREIARGLAAAFDGRPRSRDDTLRTAVWQLDGGSRVDHALMVEAAAIARWRYDFELAEDLAQVAVEGGAGFEARLLVGQLARLRGDPVRAEQEFAALALQTTTDDERGRLACCRVDNLIMSMGRRTEGIRVAAEASAAIESEHWRDQLAGRHLGGIMGERGPQDAIDAILPVWRRATGSARLYLAIGASYGLCRTGRIAESLDVAAQSYEEHQTLTETMDWYPWIHLWARCEALAAAGNLDEATALADEQYEQGLGEHSPEARAFFGWTRARTAILRGRPQSAIRDARESVLLFRQLGRPTFASFAAIPLALGLVLTGHEDEAAEALHADRVAGDDALWNGAERLIASAWVEVARGDIVVAREILEEAVSHGERIGDLVGVVTALHSLVRLGAAADCAGRLAQFGERVEGPLVTVQVDHARAAVDKEPKQLLEVADRFGALGADLLAAEAALDAAVSFRRAGEPRQAAAAERRASMLVGRCEGARTPALLDAPSRSSLTPAERTTAMLAATGRTNRQIAAHQHLSIRTVQNRLQSIYVKLGVSGREELAAALDGVAWVDPQ